MLRGVKSFSTVDFHVERGLLSGCFHDRGSRAPEAGSHITSTQIRTRNAAWRLDDNDNHLKHQFCPATPPTDLTLSDTKGKKQAITFPNCIKWTLSFFSWNIEIKDGIWLRPLRISGYLDNVDSNHFLQQLQNIYKGNAKKVIDDFNTMSDKAIETNMLDSLKLHSIQVQYREH